MSHDILSVIAGLDSAKAHIDRLDSDRKRLEAENYRLQLEQEGLLARVEYLTETLCFENTVWAIKTESGQTKNLALDPEKIGAVLEERDSLKAESGRLRFELENVFALLQGEYPSVLREITGGASLDEHIRQALGEEAAS